MAVLIHKNIKSDKLFFSSSDELLKQVAFSCDEKSKNIHLILPTGRLQRKYENSYVHSIWEKHKKPATDPKIYTFDSFVKLLLSQYFQNENFHFVNELYKFGLFDQSRNEERSFFGKNNPSPPLHAVRKIFKLIEGLKKDGITPINFLEEILEEKNKNSEKLISLGKLFQKYQNKFNGNLIDSPLATSKLIKYFTGNKTLNTDNLPLLYFDFFFEFNKPEAELLSALANYGYRILIKLDYSESDKPLPAFTNTSLSIAGFLDNGFEIKFLDSHRKSKALSLLQSRLFSNTHSGEIEEFSNCLNIVECESKSKEVRQITKLVKYLHLEKGIRLNQMIIVARSTSAYAPYFKEEFARAGVPINISERFELICSPIAYSILNILDLILSGFEGELLLSFASNHFINLPENLNINTLLLKKYLYQFRLVNNKIDGIDQIAKQLDEKIKSTSHKREKENIFKVKEDITSIYNLIESELENIDAQKLKPQEFRDLIIRFIRKFSLTWPQTINIQNLGNDESDDKFSKYLLNREIEKNSKAISAFTKLINELSFVLQSTSQKQEQSLSYFAERLRAALSDSKYQIRELYDFGVTFTSFEQSRGLDKEVSILCGFNDEVFPMPFQTDKIIGKLLYSSKKTHIARERNLFYHFLASGDKYLESNQKEIYIFYPKSANNKELGVSPFVEELARISGIKADDLIKNPDYYPWSKINTRKIKNNISNPNWTKHEQVKIDQGSCSLNIKNKLMSHAEKDKSPSSIEKYAADPYLYFLNNVLGLNDDPTFGDSISQLEKGSILHKITEKFCRSVIDTDFLELQIDSRQSVPVLNLDPNKKDDYLNYLSKIAEEEFKKIEYSHPYFSAQKETILGSNSHSGLLYSWLDYELMKLNTDNPWRAAFFEFVFHDVEIEDGTRIGGRIDRIDLRKSGEEIQFLIYDYKLRGANLSTKSEILSLVKFQLPLYIIATKIILEKKYEIKFTPKGGIYQFFIPNYKNGRKSLINSTMLTSFDGFSPQALEMFHSSKNDSLWNIDEFNEALENTSKRVGEINELIGSGDFLQEEIKKNSFPNKEIKLLEKMFRV